MSVIVYAIFTADGLDQIVETLALAKREVRDLKRLGCDEARYEAFPTEDVVYAYCEAKHIHT